MAGAKKSNADGKLARRFISSLAKELVSDSKSGYSLARNSQAINDALRKSVDSLPSGKLRSALQAILEQESRQEAFVSALQNEIRAVSAKLELLSDVILTSSASERLFEMLLNSIRSKSSPYATGNPVLSQEEVQLILIRNPAPHILWALAAMNLAYADDARSVGASMKLSSAGGMNHLNLSTFPLSASASALLHCLKPWIVGRDASVAIITMAPIVPLIYESIQHIGRDVSNLKMLRALVKEVLSFIMAAKYKENIMKRSAKSDSQEILSLSSLLDGFQAVYKAFELQGIVTQSDASPTTDKLSRLFPLVSELTRNVLKPPNVGIRFLADIVKSELLLLYMVLEVLCLRKKLKDGDKLKNSKMGMLGEQVVRIAFCGLPSDLMLDILHSELTFSDNLLDDEEKSLLCVSIFKAILFDNNGFLEKSIHESSSTNKKTVESFMKRIAVARKIATKQRTQPEFLENLVCYLKVPPKLVDYSTLGKRKGSLPRKGTLDDRTLIGWLLRVNDEDFQQFVKQTTIPDTQQEERKSSEKLDVGKAKAKEFPSSDEICNQTKPDELFFLDTTGEDHDPDITIADRQNKKSKKRKKKQVLYHRQGHVMKIKEDAGLNGGLDNGDSNDSSENQDTQSLIRGKRRNRREIPASLNGTEDGDLSEGSTDSSDSRGN